MRRFILAILFLTLFFNSSFSQELEESIKFAQSKSLLNTLSKFSEPQIYSNEKIKGEIYRLIIWQTFYSPISLRLERGNNETNLTVKQLSGEGGYETGKVKFESKLKISEKQFQKFKLLIERSKFSALKTKDELLEGQNNEAIAICLDGATWTLESMLGNNYHAIERYCPEDKDILNIGFYLIKLSKLKIKKSELF